MSKVTFLTDDGFEVVLTGRIAERPQSARVAGAPPRGAPARKVEVTPVNIEDGSWRRFYTEAQLLQIFDTR